MELLRNAIGGARWGLIVATLLSAWVALLALASGSVVIRSRTGDSIHAGRIIAIYFAAGLVLGAFLGATRRLMKWRLGAAVLGVITTAPLIAAVIFAARAGSWTGPYTAAVVVGCFAFGAPAGIILRTFVQASERQHRKVQ
jgi:hypothetical protein